MSTCIVCGKPFRQPTPWRLTCRGKCTREHHVAVFQARREWDRIRDRMVAYLIQRDHGRCGLCRRPVRALSGRMGPTGDHITPLNLGGTNEPENLQLAHKSCNSVKRDRSIGQQLLIG